MMPLYRRLLRSLAPAAVLALAAAAPAVAAPAPAPIVYTAAENVPPALSSAAEYVFGSHYAKQLPVGTAALVWNMTLVADQTTDLTMQCPVGMVVADLNITGPSSGSGETTQLPDFTPWYGQNAPAVSFGTHVPGPLTWAVLCIPKATATTTVVSGRSPVNFAATHGAPAVKQGGKLPKGATVLKSTVTGANPGGTYVSMTKGCPGGALESPSVISSPGNGGTGAVGADVILYPSAKITSGAVTVYALCAPPAKPLP
jgi:hypothetical protein